MMKKRVLIAALAVLTLCTTGCTGIKKKAAETITPTPTPVPTAAPTPIPTSAVTTPVPTSTPAPRIIGVKTSTAAFIYLTNNTENALREVYLKTSGSEEWGKNLVANESTVKSLEQVQMFYTPQSSDSRIYDMKIVDKAGNAYVIYSIDFGDMESAALRVQDQTAYLSYMSLSTRKETNTQYTDTISYSGNSGSNGLEDSGEDDFITYDYSGDDSDDGDSNEGNSNSGEYNDMFFDGYYDPSHDYSEFEGNYNYGYYDDNGNWISYY